MAYIYTENDIDALYEWVHEYKHKEFAMTKDTYEEDLDSYVQGNFDELVKEYELYVEANQNDTDDEDINYI